MRLFRFAAALLPLGLLSACLTPNAYPAQPLAPSDASYVISRVTLTPSHGEDRMKQAARRALSSYANAARDARGAPMELRIAISETYDPSGLEEVTIGNAAYAQVRIELLPDDGRSRAVYSNGRRFTVGADDVAFGDPLLDPTLNTIANAGVDESEALGRQIAAAVKSDLLGRGVRLPTGVAVRQ